jgi:tRNA nucleotidyltransferase/poly(A) polymerase
MSLRDELLRRFPALSRVPAESFVVGGAVRDLLLGLDPADVDVACRDPLACAQSVSDRVIRLGTGDHLSAFRVVFGGHVYDFAELLDGNIDADLARRDFTINAMAVPLSGVRAVLDPHDGRGDLSRRLVRMIDESNFDDDPLRCLKAVRMAVQFGFEIDPDTLAAIRKRAQRISDVAPERVSYELSVIFSAGRFRQAVALLRATALDAPLFGGIGKPFQADDLGPAGAYALLVTDPHAYAKRWRWSAALLRDVLAIRALVDAHDRVALFDAGEAAARQLPAVLLALGRDGAVAMPDFATRSLLDGEEIGRLTGLGEGLQLGRIKRRLLEAQLRGEIGSRDDAIALVRGWHVN